MFVHISKDSRPDFRFLKISHSRDAYTLYERLHLPEALIACMLCTVI